MESPAMNFSRVIFLFLVVLGACFMVAGRIGTSGFCAVILTSAVAVAIIHNLDSLTRLGLKSGSAEATLEVTRQLRDEVFAKAVQVQRQAEQAAAISAWVVSITNRLVGESFQEQLLERRDELRAMLADLDVPPKGSARSLCRLPKLLRTTIGCRFGLKFNAPALKQSAGLNNRSMQSSKKLWRHLRILIDRQDYWSFDGMRSNTISNGGIPQRSGSIRPVSGAEPRHRQKMSTRGAPPGPTRRRDRRLAVHGRAAAVGSERA